MKFVFFIVMIFFNSVLIFAQSDFGIFASVSLNIGSVRTRAGLALNFYLYNKNFQITGRTGYIFNGLPLGPPVGGREFQVNMAIGAGVEDWLHDVDIRHTYLQNFMQKKYALGYSLNFYFDNAGTSQRTGTIFTQYGQLALFFENDILAQRASDKFRTAAIKFSFFKNEYIFSLSSVLWTPDSKNVERVYDSLYPARWGYKDLTKQKYGKYSTGLLAVEVGYTQYLFAVGIQSERIRHFLQNKLIHDMYFIPKKINKARNPHYPMVASDGTAFLFKKGQKVKPANFYWNVGNNSSLFY